MTSFFFNAAPTAFLETVMPQLKILKVYVRNIDQHMQNKVDQNKVSQNKPAGYIQKMIATLITSVEIFNKCTYC